MGRTRKQKGGVTNGHLNYHSFQTHGETINGTFRVKEKEVNIKNGNGTKTVRFRGPRGGTIANVTKKLTKDEVKNILSHNFIPNLFQPCIDGCEMRANNSKTRRRNN